MTRFMYIYRGPLAPADEYTAEESAQRLADWAAWEVRVGAALVDDGAPFGERTAVRDDGTVVAPAELQGYGVVEADSLEVAVAIAGDHPFLSEGQGRFTLDVFELVDLGPQL